MPCRRPAPHRRSFLPQGKSFTLANGLTVIHHYNGAVPLVSSQLVVKSGSGANPLAQPGLSSFTAQLLQEGTATRSAPQIADDVAQLGALLSTGSGVDASFAQLTSLKATFPQALDVLADVVLHPQFPQEEVERQRASRIGQLAQQRENAGAVAARVEAAALYGPQHPYGYYPAGHGSGAESGQPRRPARFLAAALPAQQCGADRFGRYRRSGIEGAGRSQVRQLEGQARWRRPWSPHRRRRRPS